MEAHAWTRLTRRPGVCMGASGPGTTNLLTGVANAWADAAPLVAIGGSSAADPVRHGGLPGDGPGRRLPAGHQVGRARPTTSRRIPDMVATAFRQATAGRPGPVYLDLPGDVLGEKIEESSVTYAGAVEALAALARRSRRDPRGHRAAGPGRAAARSSRAAACCGRRARRRSRRSSRPPACPSTPRPSRAA